MNGRSNYHLFEFRGCLAQCIYARLRIGIWFRILLLEEGVKEILRISRLLPEAAETNSQLLSGFLWHTSRAVIFFA
jgi:hypothetical protein